MVRLARRVCVVPPWDSFSHPSPHALAALSKKLACANQGLWRNFEESQDVSDVMADYYQFLAAATVRKEPIFTEPYPDPTYANLMVRCHSQHAVVCI